MCGAFHQLLNAVQVGSELAHFGLLRGFLRMLSLKHLAHLLLILQLSLGETSNMRGVLFKQLRYATEVA